MATLKQRLHRKNAAGTFDTVHLESSSDLILRPSGRTVEQDLADYLPRVQNNDNVPQTLGWVRGSTKAYIGKKSISFDGHTHDDRYYTESEVNNLLSGKAASSHNHSASQITSGTLPVTRGGTGVTSISALKSVLGITSGSANIEVVKLPGTEAGNTHNYTLPSSYYSSAKAIMSMFAPNGPYDRYGVMEDVYSTPIIILDMYRESNDGILDLEFKYFMNLKNPNDTVITSNIYLSMRVNISGTITNIRLVANHSGVSVYMLVIS